MSRGCKCINGASLLAIAHFCDAANRPVRLFEEKVLARNAEEHQTNDATAGGFIG